MTIGMTTIQFLLTVLLTATGVWAASVRPVLKRFDRQRELADALLGEKAIPELGKPERPGLFVTVARLAAGQESQGVRLATMEHTQQAHGAVIEQMRLDVAEIKAAAEGDRLVTN